MLRPLFSDHQQRPSAGSRAGYPAANATGASANQPARKAQRGTRGVLDFLRIDDKMASLLPAVTRMATLQKDCAELLPDMFRACAVLQFGGEQLVLAVPNAAIASRLKQKLPKLQESLNQRGWQVNAIRLKVQVGAILIDVVRVKQAVMPERALVAMAELETALPEQPRNAPLKAALANLLRNQRRG
jgi:hypothetical protein